MADTNENPNEQRVVEPPTLGPAHGTSPVFNVVLGPDEEVEWQWTHTPGGASVVTGYRIRKKEGEFDIESAVKDLLWPRRRVGF